MICIISLFPRCRLLNALSKLDIGLRLAECLIWLAVRERASLDGWESVKDKLKPISIGISFLSIPRIISYMRTLDDLFHSTVVVVPKF